jgi:hypothetical protein
MTPEPEIITHSRPELHLWQYLHTKTDENMHPDGNLIGFRRRRMTFDIYRQ